MTPLKRLGSLLKRVWIFIVCRPVTVGIAQFDPGSNAITLKPTLEAAIERAFYDPDSGSSAKLITDAEPAEDASALVSVLPDPSGTAEKLLKVLPRLRHRRMELCGVLTGGKEGAVIIVSLLHGNSVKAYEEIRASDFGINSTANKDEDGSIPAADYHALAQPVAIWLEGALMKLEHGDRLRHRLEEADWTVKWRDWESYALFHAGVMAHRRADRRLARQLYEASIQKDRTFIPPHLNLAVLELHQVFRDSSSHQRQTEVLEAQIAKLKRIREIIESRESTRPREWFVTMFNLAAAWEYRAGDLSGSIAELAIHNAHEILCELTDALSAHLVSDCEPVLWHQLLEIEKRTLPFYDTVHLRREWLKANSGGFPFAGWHGKAMPIVERHRAAMMDLDKAHDPARHYALACLYAGVAELTPNQEKRQNWLGETMAHLDSYLGMQQSVKPDWPIYDPSLRAARRHLRLEFLSRFS